VWPVSITIDRPLRSSSRRASSPVVSTPMSALTMKMPPNVIRSISPRNGIPPLSPASVPGSSECMNAAQMAPNSPRWAPSASVGATRTRTSPPTRIITPVTAASQAISAGVPRDIVLSNQYRNRLRIMAPPLALGNPSVPVRQALPDSGTAQLR
jgi:hypothetical protein